MGKLLKFPDKGTITDSAKAGRTPQSAAARAFPPEQGVPEAPPPNVIPLETPVQELPDFSTFHKKILEGDLVSAGELLSFLLGITHFQGIESARAYRFLDKRTGQAQEKVHNLFETLSEGRTNESLMLLADSFGISGSRAVLVLQHLKSQS